MKHLLISLISLLLACVAWAAYPTVFQDLSGKFGYKSPTGQTVIRARYDNALSFREGYAPVEIRGKWGFVDVKGRTVAKCIYDEVLDFNFGYAIVCKKGKWGAIDTHGKEVIPCMFDNQGEISDVKVYLVNHPADSISPAAKPN